ncbi:serine hydrolase [Cyanobacterium sp. uoEpiScrs1]|uniref:serine hydrolase n=1 Tax=Cyanobacterium sp. uoEpiScrs1 TaxID=2976343 RepID=UPI002269E28E|nr:serine hydrolase [Cyanobacterium sp. uoEpiScrs1]
MAFFKSDDILQQLGNRTLEATWSKFPQLTPDQLALTWIVYDSPVIANTGGAISAEEFWKHSVRGFSYRGIERIYPASIVKLFYLVAIHEWLEGKMTPESEELNRAIRDMVVNSSNDATSLVVDVLTGTTSGPELSADPFDTWQRQRNIINRYFKSLGWEGLAAINVNQKTWCDGPYGRERVFVGKMMENRNMLTTNAVAQLLYSIVGGVAVSSKRSQQMMELLKRNLTSKDFKVTEEENQVIGFLGEGLPPNAQLWSKAGWTSQVRHDAAYIQIPGCQPYLLVIFTEGQNSKNKAIIPFISQEIVKAIAHL